MKTKHKLGVETRINIRMRRDFFPEMNEGKILLLAKVAVLESARNHAASFKPLSERDVRYGWGTDGMTEWQDILAEPEA